MIIQTLCDAIAMQIQRAAVLDYHTNSTYCIFSKLLKCCCTLTIINTREIYSMSLYFARIISPGIKSISVFGARLYL